jgi:ribonucleotide reductase alpha subunit
MKTVGLRNSLLIAIAPTATIASIVGCYECIEPQISNLFKRETLSGEFMQINRYLVDELKRAASGPKRCAPASRWPKAPFRRSPRSPTS